MPNDRTCADCGESYRRRGRPALVPRCVACTAKRRAAPRVHVTTVASPAFEDRLRQSRRETADYETVWNGGEGLCAGGGSSLSGLR